MPHWGFHSSVALYPLGGNCRSVSVNCCNVFPVFYVHGRFTGYLKRLFRLVKKASQPKYFTSDVLYWGEQLSAFLFVAKVWLSWRHLTSLEADTGWKQLLGIIFFWICVFKDTPSATFLVRWLKLNFQVWVLVNFIILELLLALL